MTWSQYGQDKYVKERYFSGLETGFFLELGALDGLRHSNTKMFEEIGWAGICVEAHPELFSRLVRNRKCICVEALVAAGGSQDNRFLAIDPNGPVGLSGLIDNYDARHLQRIASECRAAGVNATEIRIPSRTMADILREYSIRHIDFFSLDVEGAELDVLRSIAWREVTFSVILVENNYSSTAVEEFLSENGYGKVESRYCDEIYTKI